MKDMQVSFRHKFASKPQVIQGKFILSYTPRKKWTEIGKRF